MGIGISKYNVPEHWRARAAQARAMADQLIHPDAKVQMRAIAEQYDKLADRVERLKADTEGQLPLDPEGDAGSDGDRD